MGAERSTEAGTAGSPRRLMWGVLSRLDRIRPRHLFLVGFVLQAVVMVALGDPVVAGDEKRYMGYAENLVDGFYTPADDPDFTSGPGYPLVLAPFVAAGMPTWLMRGSNAVWLGLGALFVYRALLIAGRSHRVAALGGLALGTYLPLLFFGSFLLTEAFSVFLAAAFAYLIVRLFTDRSRPPGLVVLAGATLGLLALTKTVFGVLVFLLLVVSVTRYVRARSADAGRIVAILGVALTLTAPYLAYTYAATGKVLHWSTNGGELLYWMASPYDGESGSWLSKQRVAELDELHPFHRTFHLEVEELSAVARDDAFRRQGLQFLLENPAGYFSNLAPNVTRLFLDYPRTGEGWSLASVVYGVANLPLLIAGAAALSVARRWRTPVGAGVALLGSIAVAFVLVSVLLPATARYLVVIVPLAVVVIGSVIARTPGGSALEGGSPSVLDAVGARQPWWA